MNTATIYKQEQHYGKVIHFPLSTPTDNNPNSFYGIDDFDRDINTRHDAEPFKNKEDISNILTYFWDKHIKSWNTAQRQPSRKWNPRYLRNYMLFQIGFNCGLRSSDLTRLQVGYFINANGTYRETTEILEKKTSTTRVNRDTRTIYINQQIINAIELYKEYHPNWTRQDYLFPNNYSKENKPSEDYITRQNLDLIIKDVTKKLELNIRVATHSLRKSFAYHMLQMLGSNDRGVKILQQILNHKSIESTYHYIGITQDEILNAHQELQLGLSCERM